MILSLNDEDEWTREQIADWVATIEAQQDATSLDTPQIQEPVRA
jgi:predicted alpha/beta hydrolase family esterase